MILSYFNPPWAERPSHPIGCSLSQRAWPLECRTPEPLAKMLKRLDRR